MKLAEFNNIMNSTFVMSSSLYDALNITIKCSNFKTAIKAMKMLFCKAFYNISTVRQWVYGLTVPFSGSILLCHVCMMFLW